MFDETRQLNLLDLVSLEFLQKFQDTFSETMGVASVIVDRNGPITKPSNFSTYCTKFTQWSNLGLEKCVAGDIKYGKNAAGLGKPIIYTCHAGLTNFAVPIIVEGEHIASILGAQVFLEPPNEEEYREKARRLNINEDEYLEEIRKIKIIPLEKLKLVADSFFVFANLFSEIGLKNLKLAQKNKAALIQKTIIEAIRNSLDIEQTKQEIVNVIGKYFEADRCYFLDFDKSKDAYLPVSTEYISSEDMFSHKGTDVNVEVPNFTQMLKSGQNIVINNSEIDMAVDSTSFDDERIAIDRLNIKSAFAIPLRYKKEVLGALVLHYVKEKHIIKEEEQNLLIQLSNQISLAIKQAKLFTVIEKKTEYEKILREIMLSTVSTFDVKEIIKSIVTKSGELLKADRCFFVEYNIKTQSNFPIRVHEEYLASPNIKSHLLRQPTQKDVDGFLRITRQKKATAVDNIYTVNLPESAKQMLVDELQVKSYLIVPVFYHELMYGSLVFHYVVDFKKFEQNDVDIALTIANQSAIVLHQSQLYEQTKLQAEREKLIANIIAKAVSTFDITQIKQMVNEIGTIMKSDRCYFVEVDLENMKGKPIDYEGEYLASPDIKSVIGYDFPTEEIKKFIQIFLETKDLSIFDYEEIFKDDSGQYDGPKRYASQFELKNSIAIPFYYMEELTAVLVIEYTKVKTIPSEDELDFLRILGNQVGIAFSQIQNYKNTLKIAENEKTLRKIMMDAVSVFDTNQVINLMVKEIGALLKADRCFFARFNADYDIILPASEYSEYVSSEDINSHLLETVTKDETNVFIEEIKRKEVVIVENVDKIDLPEITKKMLVEKFLVKSYLILPVFSKNKIYGALVLHYVQNYKHFTQDEIDVAIAIANQSAIVINQSELYERTKIQAEREKFSRNIIDILRNTLDKQTIKHLFVTYVGKFFKADRVFFSDFDDKGKMYQPVVSGEEYLSSPEEKSLVGFDWSNDLVRNVIQPLLEKRELNIYNWNEYIISRQREDGLVYRFEDAGVKSSYNFPVLYQEQILGYFCLEFTHSIVKLSDEDITNLRNICVQAGIALYYSELYSLAKESVSENKDCVPLISNELNYPIVETISVLDSLLKPDFVKDDSNEYLNSLQIKIKQLSDLKDNIELMSKIKSNMIELNYENVNSESLVIGVVDNLKPFADIANISLAVETARINVFADPKLLTRILYNILSIAIKFVPKIEHIRIKLELEYDKFIILINLNSTADFSFANIIFEKFKCLDSYAPVKKVEAGLDLSIARKLTELHKGITHVEFSLEEGTQIRIEFPNAFRFD